MDITISLILPLIILICYSACLVVISTRAGYPGWYGLLMLVPLVNLFVLVHFALTEWPIELELRSVPTGGITESDKHLSAAWILKMRLKKATRLENGGRYEEALAVFKEVEEESNTPHNRELAREAIQRLSRKLRDE